MSAFRRLITGAAATLLALAAGSVPAPAAVPAAGPAPVVAPAADEPTPKPKPTKLFTMQDSRITESSGLAKSVKHPGIWWTTNDSNDVARIFGVNEDGEVVAVLTYSAPVRDVEALAIGKDGRIYIGDIGDNDGDAGRGPRLLHRRARPAGEPADVLIGGTTSSIPTAPTTPRP